MMQLIFECSFEQFKELATNLITNQVDSALVKEAIDKLQFESEGKIIKLQRLSQEEGVYCDLDFKIDGSKL
jgi:hypothetical protein